jgi:RES domain-containing protein
MRVDPVPSNVIEAALYWVGVVMAAACLILTATGNTSFGWRFEHAGVPLSWLAAGLAVICFLAYEYYEPGFATEPEMAPEAETEVFDQELA